MDYGMMPIGTVVNPTSEVVAEAAAHDLGALLDAFPLKAAIVAKKVNSVYEFERGLVRQDHGRAPQVFALRDIVDWRQKNVHVHKAATTRVEFRFRFIRADGDETVLFGNYMKPKTPLTDAETKSVPIYAYHALGDTLCAKLAGEQLGTTLAELDEGRAATFGDIQATREGLRCKGDFVPWHAVEKLDTSSGRFSVTETDRRRASFGRDVEFIPRFSLLWALAGAMVGRNGAGR